MNDQIEILKKQESTCGSAIKDNKALFNCREAVVTQLPDYISTELVRGCFLKCKLCALRTLGNKPRFMDFELYKQIIDQASLDGKKRTIHLTNLGETLLYPRLIDAIDYAKKSGHRVSLVSNGMILTRELADELIASKVDQMIFSVDGFKKNTFESIRVGAEYAKVLSNIFYYVSRRDHLFPEGRVQVQTIYCEQTKDEIETYKEFWRQFSVDTGVLAMHDWNSLKADSSDISIDDSYLDFNQDRYPCSLAWNMMLIDYTGKPLMCSYDFESDMSNISEKSLEYIYTNEYLPYRLDHISSEYKLSPCKNCSAWPDTPEFL